MTIPGEGSWGRVFPLLNKIERQAHEAIEMDEGEFPACNLFSSLPTTSSSKATNEVKCRGRKFVGCKKMGPIFQSLRADLLISLMCPNLTDRLKWAEQ